MYKPLNEKSSPLDAFSDARRESSKKGGYNFKTKKNENKRDFICEYIKYKVGQDSNIQECAQDFLLIKRGINPENYFCERDIASTEEIEIIFDTIKKMADSDFILLYKSYLKKIHLGYNQDIINSALEDVKIAYATLRKCKFPDWDCPKEMITIKEMENLYTLLVPKQGSNTDPNKNLEEK